MHSKRFDVLVIGSGAADSLAVKELTERGLEVLLLEAGPNVTEDDFKKLPSAKNLGASVCSLAFALPFAVSMFRLARHSSKSTCRISSRTTANTPTPPPRDEFFLWIRGRQLGGRLHTCGRMLCKRRLGNEELHFSPAEYQSSPPIRLIRTID